MSNQLAGNPWILDGSSLTKVLVTTWIKVEHFEYSGYTSNTSSKAQLADRNGNVIWTATGATDNEEVRSGKVGWINGLQELSHTDGKVLVYFD
jgi:hypothetical protein